MKSVPGCASCLLYPRLFCSVFVVYREITEVIISTISMADMSPGKDRLTFQIFPDPSDFERCCKLKDWLPSIVVEATEGEVESGELRWLPKEYLLSKEEDEEEHNGKVQGLN